MEHLESLSVTNFRGIRKLHLDGFAQVNLFVGRNNAGKTSVLEAIDIALSRNKALAIRDMLVARDERMQDGEWPLGYWDPRYLFHRHGQEDGPNGFEIVPNEAAIRVEWVDPEEFDEEPWLWGLRLATADAAESVVLADRFFRERREARFADPYTRSPRNQARFIRTSGASNVDPQDLWAEIVLTPDEEAVIQALSLIDTDIARIALVSDGFYVLHQSGLRMPLGSTGDGMQRLLSLAIHLTSAKNSALLIDEIDTGIHYSVLANLWRLVLESSRKLSSQVFATTHSLDCLRALAEVCENDPSSDVTVHRLEREMYTATRFSGEELRVAMAHELEVR